MKYYVETLKLQRESQPASNLQNLADEVITNIEQNELIRQGASKLGITVSDDAVEKELKSADLPNDDVHRDLVRTQLLINELLDEYSEPQVPVSAEQRNVMAMLLESEEQVAEIKARLEIGESFTELAEELSLEFYSKANQGDFGWLPKEILNDLLGTFIAERIFSAQVGVLSQPVYDEEITKGVGYWLVKVLDRNEEEEEASVQLMLLNSEAEAQQITDRLEAGDAFATLAKEFSLLDDVEENEGKHSLASGSTSPILDEFMFDPETQLETVSEPIRDETITTEGGYWLIKVVAEDENRRIEKEDRDWLEAKALNEWLISLWDDPANVVDDSYHNDENKAWAIEQAMNG
jgi:parvulin-like peptidyl-prolyl isomerase